MTLPALRIGPERALFVLLTAGLTLVASAGLCAVAVVLHAPPLVLPLLIPVCVGAPVLASWEVPSALLALRLDRSARASRSRALVSLRKALDQLPETEHPLDL